jgi:hypothetical protein
VFSNLETSLIPRYFTKRYHPCVIKLLKYIYPVNIQKGDQFGVCKSMRKAEFPREGKREMYRIFLYTDVPREKSIFLEVIVSVILSKKMSMYLCPLPNGFRDGDI